MDIDTFTTSKRKGNLEDFMKNFTKEFNLTYKNGKFRYRKEIDMFKKKRLSSGVEGVVYLSNFKNKEYFKNQIVIKVVNLLNIKETKDVKKSTINMTPSKLYDLFLTNKAFKDPSLIELISQTLVNQLIFQNICPNYTLNYYWEYESSKNLNSYNEYINSGDFDEWAKESHTDLEWFNALFQIMAGLYALKKYFNMLHTDFHTKNILVHKVKRGGYWKYIIDNKTYYVPNLGYIFIINDFGFAWVPDHIYMKWYYKQRLRYITKAGQQFYDLSIFLKSILDSKSYKLPYHFLQVISKLFKKEEVVYIITKNYYGKYYDKSNPKYISYPDIDINYNGVNTNIGNKIDEIFYKKYKYNTIVDFNYSKKINDNCIETYSLDKKFDKSKLPSAYKNLVTN